MSYLEIFLLGIAGHRIFMWNFLQWLSRKPSGILIFDSAINAFRYILSFRQIRLPDVLGKAEVRPVIKTCVWEKFFCVTMYFGIDVSLGQIIHIIYFRVWVKIPVYSQLL